VKPIITITYHQHVIIQLNIVAINFSKTPMVVTQV